MRSELKDKEGVAIISHEIKNSIAGLKTGIEMLRDMGSGDEKEISDTLFEELKYLQELTFDVLSLTGSLDLNLEKVNIKKLSKESSEIVTGNASFIDLNFGEKFPSVMCDRNLMKSVLINLINNAYEEVGDKGKIEVGGKSLKQGMIEIWVEDNGSGIKGNVNLIFKNFKSQKKQGTGIGLALTSPWATCG
ncbi:MAG: HAMP domain-containing sensor histidine kinase, partial [candidate division WOR-3 bacterium]